MARVLVVAPGLLLGRLGERQAQGADVVAGHLAPSHGSTSANRSSAARSLSPRPEKPRRTRTSSGQEPPTPPTPASSLGSAATACAVSSAGQDPLGAGRRLHRGDGLAVGRGGDLDPAALGERGQLRADPRVVEAGRGRVRLGHLAVGVLEHQRTRAVEDAGRAAEDRRGMAPGLDAVAGRLDDRQPDRRLADEPGEQPDGVRAATDAGDGEIRQAALDGGDLGRRLVADPALEVADDRRIRVRAHRRAEDVVGRLDVGHPVAHRLVDRVLERRRAGGHGADLGTQGAHPQHVRALPLDVLGAHVDDARQVEQRAGGRGRDAVLAGAGLGDDPGLAEPPGEQRLAERVVDLVRAGVGEVLALEVEAEVRDARRRGRPSPASRARLVADGLGQAIGTVERGRAPGEVREQLAQLGPEDRVLAERVVGGLELLERGHQRLGHVATTEVALHPPPPGAVGVEQAGDGRGSGRRRRSGDRRGRRGLA